MNEVITKAVNSFSVFISENELILKKQITNGILVSYAVEVPDYDINNKIDALIKHFKRTFYFEIPNENFKFLGVDEILSFSESGEGRFAATDKKIKEWKNNFINNWKIVNTIRIPLFMGAMKFTVEHPSDDWLNFNDSTWFVPEFIFFENKQNNYLIYNFIYYRGNTKELLLERFRKKLDKLFSIDVKGSNENYENLKVVKLTGNSPKEQKKWKILVNGALEKIRDNMVEKVVLSRRIEIHLSNEPDLSSICKKLRETYPDCYLFIYHHEKSSFIGASPEKLGKFSEGKIELDALAGSAPRGKTEDEDSKIEQALLNDQKNLNEHDFVIEYIKDAVSPLTTDFSVNNKYMIKKLANIQHLWTPITASLTDSISMFKLLKELYPTPAICGYPKEAAQQIIKKDEGYRRGLYSGIVGWFNLNDEGEFAIAIRSALSINNRIIAFAGGGIVKDSEPVSEFEETELKLKTIINLFNNETKN